MTPEIEKRIKLVQAGKVPAGYKLSKVGVIPNEWSLTYLKDVAIHVTEKNKDNAISLTLTNSATKGVIKQTEYFDKQISNKENTDGYFVVQNGDYIYNPRISESAPCGPINRSHLGESGIASPLYTVFRMNSDVYNECYIEMFLKSPFWHRYMCGVANYGARHDRMNITNEDLFSMPLPVPSKKEQEKIAEILAAQDRVIELKEKLVAEKIQVKDGISQQLLSGQRRLLGCNDDWKKSFFKSIIKVISGYAFDSGEFSDIGMPVVRIQNIANGVVETSNALKHPIVEIDEDFIATRGDVLVAMSGATTGKTGIYCNEEPSYINQRVGKVKVIDDCICKEFVAQYFMSTLFLNELKKKLVAGAQPNIGSQDIDKMQFVFPLDKTEQQAIAKVLSAADEEISLLQKDLEQEKMKKKSLMQLLLTGLVRVSA